ncbi:MAG: UPF0158 family protein [Actinomycetota bacterium]
MDAKERRAELRGAVNRADGVTVVRLAPAWLGSDEALQLLGDGLLAALVQQVDGGVDLAAECAGQLRERGWDGDENLAEHLEAALVGGPVKLLPLAVDLEELAMILEGDEFGAGGRIDRHTGEVWSQAAIEYAEEMGDEDAASAEGGDRWLWVDSEGSHDGYRDMHNFIATVANPGDADRLEIAIQGRGAFRRFKDVLGRWPGELERWYAYSEERQRGRARAWLADAGHHPERRGGTAAGH